MATTMPEHPWERIEADLCDHDGNQYLAVVDLFTHIKSSFPQATGDADSDVKIAKRFLEQPDIFIALMAYRSLLISVTGCNVGQPLPQHVSQDLLLQRKPKELR